MTAYSPLSSSATEDPTYPGLPNQNVSRGGWVAPSATGLNEVSRAKQWVRLPPLRIAGYNFGSQNKEDPTCATGRLGDYRRITDWRASLYFISGDPHTPAPFGYIKPFDVNTVAFGTIPVKATVQISQPRDAENLPVGGEVKATTGAYCTGLGGGPFPNRPPYPWVDNDSAHWWDVSARLEVLVEVTALEVDGVDLSLRPGCRTAQPNALQASAPDYYSWDPSLSEADHPAAGKFMTTKFFGLANGGKLTGSVDIGRFAQCTTSSGEDVSPLLTSAISGPGNKVVMRSEGLQVAGCLARPIVCRGKLPGLPFPDTQ